MAMFMPYRQAEKKLNSKTDLNLLKYVNTSHN